MADADLVGIITRGAKAWNRRTRVGTEPADLHNAALANLDLRDIDLTGANLRRANLKGTDLRGASLRGAMLRGASLVDANLGRADLEGADLTGTRLIDATARKVRASGALFTSADLRGADLRSAALSGCQFSGADLSGVDLTRATLTAARLDGANLSSARLVETDLRDADLSGCRIYGLSAWGVRTEGMRQPGLVITPRDRPTITVDSLEVGQFIFLLLDNTRVRQVIDTVTSKVVLILGRFTPERKAVLDALREMLGRRNYMPVLFDFEGPSSRDLTETVSTLAHMARFVLADLSDARSIPQELTAVVPHLPSVPVVPLLVASQREYALFESLRRYPWVLDQVRYASIEELLERLDDDVIRPAEEMVSRQRPSPPAYPITAQATLP